MTYTLTDDQLSDMRLDLGGVTASTFTDDALNRLYDRCEGNYEDAVAKGIRQLRMIASKFADYTQGQSSEARSQIFKQLGLMQKEWEAKAGTSGGTLSAGTLQLGIDQDDEQDSDYYLKNRITEWTG